MAAMPPVKTMREIPVLIILFSCLRCAPRPACSGGCGPSSLERKVWGAEGPPTPDPSIGGERRGLQNDLSPTLFKGEANLQLRGRFCTQAGSITMDVSRNYCPICVSRSRPDRWGEALARWERAGKIRRSIRDGALCKLDTCFAVCALCSRRTLGTETQLISSNHEPHTEIFHIVIGGIACNLHDASANDYYNSSRIWKRSGRTALP